MRAGDYPPVLFLLAGSILLLRPIKAGLIALQYRHRALGRSGAP
jgi:uncharacterized protein (DUF983 family)